MVGTEIAGALVNAAALAGIPLLVYFLYHRKRHGRSFAEVAQRAGLCVGDVRYIGYCAALSVALVAYFLVRPPAVEPLTREGSAMRSFMGLGINGTSIALAFAYGIIKTGFSEEFFFRGLIAGSLGRRLPIVWANVIQAAIFLLPHFLVLTYAPEMWPLLPAVFLGACVVGWARIRSGSILGPWLVHAAINVTTCLLVAGHAST